MQKMFSKFWSKKAHEGENKNQKKSGFTLVEILIVVAVIGILFVTLVPRIDFAGDKARETGIKTDFRAFELAAEQYLREKGGLAECEDVEDLCAAGGINLYLDKAIQFDDDGVCAKEDQWNQNYTIQMASTGDGTNPNNGVIIFISNGKDSKIDEEDDNYGIAIAYVDGQIESETFGFSSNIESDLIDSITAGSSTTMTLTNANKATVVYDSSN